MEAVNFEDTQLFLRHSVGQIKGSLCAKTSSFCPGVLTLYRLEQKDRWRRTIRQLTFFSKLQRTDNYVLRTLAGLPMVKYEMLALAAKYSLNGVYCAVSTIKDLVWLSFAQKVQL